MKNNGKRISFLWSETLWACPLEVLKPRPLALECSRPRVAVREETMSAKASGLIGPVEPYLFEPPEPDTDSGSDTDSCGDQTRSSLPLTEW